MEPRPVPLLPWRAPVPETEDATPEPAAEPQRATPLDRSGWTARGRNPDPLEHHPPEAHARQLLAWIRTGDKRGRDGDIDFEEILEIYREMCAELLWAERSWRPVSTAFTRLTTGGKVYAWVVEADGKHKRRIYPVPGVTDRKLVHLRAGTDSAAASASTPQRKRRAA